MRILFTTWAWPSHLYPMVPLAWACRAAGHDVRVASQPALAGVVQRCGLPGVTVGKDVDAAGMVRGYVLTPGNALRPRSREPRALAMFSALVEAMADDLGDLARAWRPDVVVYEGTTLAGPVAAAAAGVPAVRHLYGLDLPGARGELLPALLEPALDRLGLGAVDPLGDLTLDPCPSLFQLQAARPARPVRYVPFNGPGAFPRWLLEPPRRPRVCVTWGTTMARLDDDLFLAGRILEGLRTLDVELVAAITPPQRRLLPATDEVRVAESVPLHLLLPTCDLVVHHGGAGTLLTALSSGLPQVVVPQLPDHSQHAQQLARSGAGETLTRQEASQQRVRELVGSVLHSHAHRDAAARMQLEMAARPAPSETVGVLESLARRPVPATAR